MFLKIIVVLNALVLFSTVSHAVNVSFDQSKLKEVNSRGGGLTAPGIFKKISQAHKYLASNKYDKAMARLASISETGTKPYSLAQVYQTRAYIYSGKGDDRNAMKYFKKSNDLRILPLGPTQSNLYMLSQLSISSKQYKSALNYMQQWFQITQKPTAPAYIMLATILVEMGKKDTALKYVNKALLIAKDPKESWLQFAAGLNMEKGQYKEAIIALNKLVKLNPKKASYWKMLSGCHLSLDQNKKALNVMSAAYQLGFLTEGQDLLNLASLYAGAGIPLEAAKVIEKGLKEKKVKSTKKNLQFLAQAWLDSEDKMKAISHLRKAASLSTDGKLNLLEGQVFMEKGKWAKAIKAFTNSLAKAKGKDKGRIFMMRGMAFANLNNFERARKDFTTLAQYVKYEKQSESWLNYVSFRQEARKVLNSKQ